MAIDIGGINKLEENYLKYPRNASGVYKKPILLAQNNFKQL